jgi:hypothetical protein
MAVRLFIGRSHGSRGPSAGPLSVDILRHLFQAGVQWETSPANQIADIRRYLLQMSDHTFVEVIKLLTDGNCSQDVLHELGRTPAMSARMKKVGFFPSSAESAALNQSRPTQVQEALVACNSDIGIEADTH